ncbi:hypothetical protein E6W36_01375 [Hankyongella ginsenosidimutans]|uniref:Enoyl-CoA hydratase/isomerase domain-containing protein n=1 Tax=Hankyongella ginsenosidimutans TaxID=1763828 RepID=A0A4D7BZ54_9SPHN|nr:enoyl-CoA hydratase/isomerase family protein [Hankyongella ginsenosidimutans]QCI78774.1 hypothetical protein E6W36_01375 [Hankyongella ginsenosidimutans]
MQDDIVLERRGGWGVATFNRPAALNALTRQMCVALDEALTAWADDPSVIGVVAHGAGTRPLRGRRRAGGAGAGP